MGKVAEVVILRRLKEQEEDLHVIPDEQFGFQRTLSTKLLVHHRRVQQERNDRSRAARCLQGLRQGFAQRTSNPDAGCRLFSRPGKTN